MDHSEDDARQPQEKSPTGSGAALSTGRTAQTGETKSRASRLEELSKTWHDLFAILGYIAAFLGAIASIAALIVAVATLQAVKEEIVHVRAQLESNASQTVTNQLLELDRELTKTEVAALRSCFVQGDGRLCPVSHADLTSSSLSDTKAEQVAIARGLAGQHLDLFDSIFGQATHLGFDVTEPVELRPTDSAHDDGWSGWSNYMVSTMKASAITCHVLEENQTHYPQSFVEALSSAGECAARGTF